MKNFLVLIGLFAVGSHSLAQQRVIVQPDPVFTARLTEMEQSSDLTPLFQTAARPKTKEELKSALDWMRTKAVDGASRDPRYLLSYAALLYMARNKDMAVAAYLAGVLMGRVESARCADSSAPASKIRQLEAETEALENEYWSFPYAQRTQFFLYALELENKKPLGKPNSWLCSGGMRDMKMVVEKAVAEGDTSGITKRTSNGKAEIVIDTSSVSPVFLGDKESEPARRKVKEYFEKYYFREKLNPSPNKD